MNWRSLARFGLGLVLLAWSLLLLAWLSLHWGILPHLDEWRPQIEQRAARALGVPVRIGRIEVRSRGWVPALTLRDVAFLDAQGQPALKLPQVAAAVSVRSLFAFTLRFEQLLIDGAALDVRRDAQGRVFVAGLPLQRGAGGNAGAAADWFFEQHEFVIRHGSITWTDELLQAPPLALRDVDLVVRNGLKRHSIRLDATPPADWGERFSLQGRFTQPLLAASGDYKRWSGSAFATLPQADLAALRRHVRLPFRLVEGEGALRAWLDIERGELRGATADLALDHVVLQLAEDLQPLALQQLQGRIGMRRDDQGVQVSAERFRLVTGEGRAWPQTRVQVGWQQRQDVADAPLTGGEFSADRLDLSQVADLAGRLPLGGAVRKLLAELQPEGELQALSARWQGALDAPQQYQVRARLSGLSIAAGPGPDARAVGRPGLRNAQIELQADEAGGQASLAIHDGSMSFPGVFEEPEVLLDRFQSQLAWRIERPRGAAAGAPAALELKVRGARFANADAEGTLQATWRTGPGQGFAAGGRFPGVLDMGGHLERGAGVRVARYLPLGIPAATRDYVARAVQGGRVDAADFKVKGDLGRFPFHDAHDGEFRIAGHVSEVTLAYAPPAPGQAEPPWPAFQQLAGELVFDRNSMEIRKASARVYGYELSGVKGAIRRLSEQPVLQIEGQGRGPLADALRYVNASPMGQALEQALKGAAASGASELRLALELPLDAPERSTVKGSLVLLNDELRLRPDLPLLAQARGRVEFTHKGFSLKQVSAQALGGAVSLDGGSLAEDSWRVVAQGTATAEGLRRETALPALQRVAASLSGHAPYRVVVGAAKGRGELSLSSPLTGLALDLPPPLRKSAEAALPLRVQLQPDPQGGARDTLQLALGNVVQAQFQRDLSREPAQVVAAALSVGEPLPAPVAGGVARLTLGSVDADAWRALAARWAGEGNGGDATAAAAGAYLPRQVALQAKSLVLGGRQLDDVVASLSALPGPDAGWRAGVVAAQLAGEIEYRGGGAGRVQARLSRLSLPKSETESVEHLLDPGPSASMPALDVVVDDFELRGKRLGRLEVTAVNAASAGEGGQRDWQLSRLNLGMPEARLQASGRWGAPVAGRRRMVLDFTLDVADSGGLLQRLGTPDALKGGKGQLQGQVAWLGSPFALDYPTLGGQLHLALDKGQFLKAGAGAGRLLGVLSLQALPRRLVLDFRDLFQEGFAFDNVSGDVEIREGVAATRNLRMRGVQALVLMEGQANLALETQDLRVFVMPEINAGTASLAYAAINPAIGLGTFVAQMFLRKPLMQASTREFRVTGGWDDPKVDKVERKATDPLPEMEGSPTAAASAPADPAAP